MSGKFNRTKTATAFALVVSMILPSVGAASAIPPRNTSTPYSAGYLPVSPAAEVTKVDHRRDHVVRRGQGDRRLERRRVERRDPPRRVERRHERRVTRPHRDAVRYRRGYRGSREYRRGYRRDNDGWWFPLAAFALGAIILNESNNNSRHVQSSGWSHIPARNLAAHDNWCDQRYRSYSRANKTFQPYNGPRRFCNSPYDNI